MNSTLNLLNNRMSLRKYDNRPISDEDINLIIEGALRAPTAGNMMLYSILVIKDESKKQKLSVTCDNQPFIAKAPVILIFLADMERLYRYFDMCDVKDHCAKNGLKYTEPNLSKLFLGAGDAFIAAQNAVVAAESLGIGSCYIGDIVENYEAHKEILNLPDAVFPVGMLCLGHYPEDAKRIISPRFDKKYIVFNEEYKILSQDDYTDMYKDNEKRVIPNNVYKASNFGQLIYSRKFGGSFSNEMERSIKANLEKWLNPR
ncbi:MAG: nitroreductase family protein [Clostridium sp.]